MEPSSASTVTKRVAVVGAGVIGLSTAVRILNEVRVPGVQVDVTLIADRFSPHTTSDVSGGLWEPVDMENTPVASIRKWSKETWDHLYQLCRSPAAQEVGAQFVSGYTLRDTGELQEPIFKDMALGYRPMTEREQKELFPFTKWGFFYTTMMISARAYLPWLTQKFKDGGGKLEFNRVKQLISLSDRFDIIINCCGPWAGRLVNDPHTQPIRGQVLRVHAPWIKHHYLFQDKDANKSYLLPLGDIVMVGGTAQRGNWNEKVDDADSQAIWERAIRLFPQLQKAQKLDDLVGLRPGRTEVRLEAETTDTPEKQVLVIHNYGHGGSGVTLHWGCAGDVVKMINHSFALKTSMDTSTLTKSKL